MLVRGVLNPLFQVSLSTGKKQATQVAGKDSYKAAKVAAKETGKAGKAVAKFLF
jgi:hypothetical protein